MTQNPAFAPPQGVPVNVAQAAAGAGLGGLLYVHQPQRYHWLLVAFGIIVGVLTVWLILGIVILWAVLRSPSVSKSAAARRIFLYEQGFVLVKRPEDPQVFRWDAINTVFQKIVSKQLYGVIEVNKYYLYTVTRNDGLTVKLTKFWAGIDKLGPFINEHVSAALLPGALAAIEQGQGIRFGDMTITAGGIAGKRKSVTWPEVSGVRIASGSVRVSVRGKFLALSTTPAAKLPNLPLFMTLAGHFQQAGR